MQNMPAMVHGCVPVHASSAVYPTDDRACFLCGAGPDGTGGDGDGKSYNSERAGAKRGPLRPCPHCNLVWYCCDDHYEIHHSADGRGRCFPFVIKRTQDKGRFMVATRDIDPLELILVEEPAVVGPYSKTTNGCLQCFKKVDNTFRCPGCRFPMCNERCTKGDRHQDECEFFKLHEKLQKENNNNSTNLIRLITSSPEVTSHVFVTPLRMLLKKKTDPKTFSRIDLLMDHAEHRAATANSINFQMAKVILLLKESSYLPEFSQAEVQRMIGIIRTNGMKLESLSGSPGVALYPVYCLINHACFNNTNYVKFPDLRLELRAQLPIRKGEEIFTRYISSTIGNVRRRTDIQKYWFFDCACPRCSDPSELGTFMSAIRCNACRTGYLLPENSLDHRSDWRCGYCDTVVGFGAIDDVMNTLEKQIGDVSENGHIAELEELLFHYSDLLHPNHYILIDIMHNLVHMYAAKASLSRPEKERKIQLCNKVLDVLTKVDSGFTIWRGTLLQELIHPLMMISKEDHKEGRISEKEFKRRLAFCGKKLREAKLCLRGGFTPVEEYIQKKGLGQEPDAKLTERRES